MQNSGKRMKPQTLLNPLNCGHAGALEQYVDPNGIFQVMVPKGWKAATGLDTSTGGCRSRRDLSIWNSRIPCMIPEQ